MTKNSNKIKVLFVEDEQDVRENIGEILRETGFEVFEAPGVREGVELFLENSPDIVVSDVMMPDLSGYDLLRIIRENKTIKNNNVPFIFLTALGQKTDVVKGISSSANDYLVKPVDFDLLIAKIKEKCINAVKVKEVYNKNISGLKTQISTIVPQELLQHVDTIRQISDLLRTEPYGPFPHKKYVDDINKIYTHSVRLKAVINNFLSGEMIDVQLDANDEVVNPVTFISEFIASLADKFPGKVRLDVNPGEKFSEIKIDKAVILEAMRRFLSNLVTIGPKLSVDVSLIMDRADQLVFIFHVIGDIKGLAFKENIEEVLINKILEKQGCHFEILLKNADANMALYIPSYRVVGKS